MPRSLRVLLALMVLILVWPARMFTTHGIAAASTVGCPSLGYTLPLTFPWQIMRGSRCSAATTLVYSPTTLLELDVVPSKHRTIADLRHLATVDIHATGAPASTITYTEVRLGGVQFEQITGTVHSAKLYEWVREWRFVGRQHYYIFVGRVGPLPKAVFANGQATLNELMQLVYFAGYSPTVTPTRVPLPTNTPRATTTPLPTRTPVPQPTENTKPPTVRYHDFPITVTLDRNPLPQHSVGLANIQTQPGAQCKLFSFLNGHYFKGISISYQEIGADNEGLAQFVLFADANPTTGLLDILCSSLHTTAITEAVIPVTISAPVAEPPPPTTPGISVDPPTVVSGQDATVRVHSLPDILCATYIGFSDGTESHTFHYYYQRTDAHGDASWPWHPVTSDDTGTVSAYCSDYKGTAEGQFDFPIAHD